MKYQRIMPTIMVVAVKKIAFPVVKIQKTFVFMTRLFRIMIHVDAMAKQNFVKLFFAAKDARSRKELALSSSFGTWTDLKAASSYPERLAPRHP
ncbi:MAG: hypothetical protein HY695_22790 [Deltaproteobacteria bacterium]|nr:hypothetical protein [Deltaproteobacteria bacterium]